MLNIEDIPTSTIARVIRDTIIKLECDFFKVPLCITEIFIDEYYEEVIETFLVHGTFLDELITDHTFIETDMNKIVMWIIEYGENPLSGLMNSIHEQMMQSEPAKAIRADIKVITKFEELIKKRVVDKDKDTPTIFMDKLLSDIGILKNDLNNKEFNLFSKDNYYKSKYTKKRELTTILKEIAKKYNVISPSEQIRQLVENIPNNHNDKNTKLLQEYIIVRDHYSL